MIPRYVRDCVKLLLQVMVMLMFLLPTPHSKQCKPTTTERDGSVIIRNVGIKLCQLKCAEIGQCLSIQYSSDTLTCRLLSAESRETKTKEGYVNLARSHSDVPDSCSSKMCSFGQRCLKTRSGQSVCLQGQKKNYPEGSPQHKVDKEETFVNSPLHDACRKGNLTRVRSILSQGLVDINSRDGNHGKTPLMVAAQEGHCRIFSFLIRKGANMSQVDNDGKNFLHWTCKGGHVGMVECVLPQDRLDINNKHMPPLLQAAWRGQRDVCEFLVCMGANVSQVDDSGYNVLHWGCIGGHLGMVKYLLSLCSVDINSSGKTGVTPLMVAARFKQRDIFEFLVRKGANVSQVDDFGYNVLHFSAMGGDVEIVKHIISQNMVKINARNKDGETAAMIAKNRRVYKFLVSRGCPVK